MILFDITATWQYLHIKFTKAESSFISNLTLICISLLVFIIKLPDWKLAFIVFEFKTLFAFYQMLLLPSHLLEYLSRLLYIHANIFNINVVDWYLCDRFFNFITKNEICFDTHLPFFGIDWCFFSHQLQSLLNLWDKQFIFS